MQIMRIACLHPGGLEMQFTAPNTKDNGLNIDLAIAKLFLLKA